MDCKQLETLLNGYIDGELDLVRSLEIEEHLKGCDDCAQAVAASKTVRSSCQDSSLYYQAPKGLSRRIQESIKKESKPNTLNRRTFLMPVTAAASIILALVLIWSFVLRSSGPSREELLQHEIVSAHIRSLMANHLSDVVSSDKHTVKPWFNGKLDFAPTVEDFKQDGYPLIGGRIDYIADRPVAALVYGHQKHFLNLFIWPANSISIEKPEEMMTQGYHLIHWTHSGMRYWLVSDMNPAELADFANKLRKE